MEPTAQERDLFQRIYEAPTDDNFRLITHDNFSHFIAHLFNLEGRFKATVTEAYGGGGDGGVDIELRANVGITAPLIALAQCKLLHILVGPAKIREFATVLRNNHVSEGYFFSGRGFTGAAYNEARGNPPMRLMGFAEIREWIQQMHQSAAERRTFPRRLGSMPIPVIAFVNNKGGVGKTTVTVNLAAAYARAGKRVLVIDADPQCNATIWLMGERDGALSPNDLTLQGVFEHHYPIQPLIRMRTIIDNVYLLPCHFDMATRVDMLEFNEEDRLAHALTELPLTDPPIDIILIDTQPALSPLTRAAIMASNLVALPLRLDEFSRMGVGRLIDFVEQTEQLKHVSVKILGGIAVAANTRALVTRRELRDIADKAKSKPRLQREIRDEDDFWIAQVRQTTDFDTTTQQYTTIFARPRSSGALDFQNLLGRMNERVTKHIFAYA